jgi:phospholipid/cholesterol/gamma-HCH transport system substrate-binding protein
MEPRANHLLIGSFVIALVIACINFAFWMQKGGSDSKTQDYVIYFQGAVNGLSRASQVLFNGIRIGRVHSIDIDSDDSRRVRVVVRLQQGAPVRANSEARLAQQALTGLAAVRITPGTMDEPLLSAQPKAGKLPVIAAAPVVSRSLTEAAPEIMGNASLLLTRLNNLVADNEASIRKTVKNIELFSETLATKREDVAVIIDDVKSLSSRLKATAEKIDKTVEQVSGFFGADGNSVLEDAKAAAQSLKRMSENLEKSLGNGSEEVITMAKRSLREIELFAADGRRAAQSLDRVLEKMDQNPQSFIFGGKTVPEYNPSN